MRAVRADGEDVEAAHRHLGAEADRLMRARLFGEPAQRRQFARGREVERRDVGRPIQPVGRQRQDGVLS